MPEVTIRDRFGGIEMRQLIVPLIILILIIGTIIGIYNYQKNSTANKAPLVEIYKPSEGQEVTDAQIIIEGKTDPKAKVSVNDNEVNIDSAGNFASEVPLAEGVNVISVKSTKPSGKTSSVERRVNRINPQPVTVSETTPTVAYGGDLDSSGPENFWLPEASLLAAAGTAFLASRRKLKNSQVK